jgi:hypothetical protein
LIDWETKHSYYILNNQIEKLLFFEATRFNQCFVFYHRTRVYISLLVFVRLVIINLNIDFLYIIMTLIACYFRRSVIFNYLYYIQGCSQTEWKHIWTNLLRIIKINKNRFIKIEYSNNTDRFFVYRYQSYIILMFLSSNLYVLNSIFFVNYNSRLIKSSLMQSVCFYQWKTTKK